MIRRLFVVDASARIRLGGWAAAKWYLGELLEDGRIVLSPTERVQRARPLMPPVNGACSDEFLDDLASAYTVAAGCNSRPLEMLAAELGVSVFQVRKWVDEARRRGFLDPIRLAP